MWLICGLSACIRALTVAFTSNLQHPVLDYKVLLSNDEGGNVLTMNI